MQRVDSAVSVAAFSMRQRQRGFGLSFFSFWQRQHSAANLRVSINIKHQQRDLLLGCNSAPVLQRQHSATLWQLQYFSSSSVAVLSTRTQHQCSATATAHVPAAAAFQRDISNNWLQRQRNSSSALCNSCAAATSSSTSAASATSAISAAS